MLVVCQLTSWSDDDDDDDKYDDDDDDELQCNSN